MSKSVNYFTFYRQSQDGATIPEEEEEEKEQSTVVLEDVILQSACL